MMKKKTKVLNEGWEYFKRCNMTWPMDSFNINAKGGKSFSLKFLRKNCLKG